MPGKMYTCPWCKRNLTEEEGIRVNKRIYHPKCLKEKTASLEYREKEKKATRKQREKHNKTIETEKEPSIPEAVPEEIAKAREKFYSTVSKVLGVETLDTVLYAQCDRMIDNYNLTWNNMRNALIYAHEMLDISITEDNCAYTVLANYSKAKKHYEEVEKIKSEKRPLEEIYKKRTVKITPKKTVPNIDITKLGE